MEQKQPDLKMIEDSQKHYSEEGLWDKVMKVAKVAGIKVIYYALLLFYTAQAPTTTMKQKGIIYGALGYFILPIDLIPDAIPVVGFSDDLAALYFCIKAVAASLTPEIKAQAEARLHDWFGDYDKREISEV